MGNVMQDNICPWHFPMDIFNAGSFCDFISLTFQQPSARSHSVRRPLDGNALLLQVQKAALTISSTCWGTGMSMNSSTCDFSQRKNTKSWHGGVLHVLTKVWVCAKFQALFLRNESPNKRKKHAPETCRCTIRKSVLIHLGFTFRKSRL